MEEESEYKKLPTDEKCVHKLWKARVAGYEEAAKLFKQIDDEKSPEWNKYLGLIKKFVSDSNALAQEKGLEAALAFVENCGHAGKTVGEVMSSIVAKCIAAPKTKTKDLAHQVTLMYIEIEKHEAVQEELMKGMEHKNPKTVSACIVAINSALRQFGNKVISIKLLVKKIPTMLTDRDKDVRTEGKALVVEMHRWVGVALEPHISQLQPVVLQELRDAFSDSPTKVTPERYLRSQQVAAPAASAGQDDDGGEDENEDEEDGARDADVDPYELLDPVDILSKLPKDFYEKLEAKKWQERKEALDALETLLKAAPKLESGDYGDLVRALKKVISKDSNVMLVALAGKCVSMLAAGLKKKFGTYTTALMPCALEKFKEKKPNVVSALREAVDAMYPCTTIEAIAEDVVEALNNKNPSVKAETASFLARAFANTQPAALTKKLIKTYVGALLKVLESADPVVRDQAAEALGTAMKLVGEKNISPFIGKLDNLKEQKIQECCEKAVILVKAAGPKKEARPKTAPAKTEAKGGSTQPKAVKRPATAGAAKKPALKKPGAPAKAAASKAAPVRDIPERELSPEEVDERAEELLESSVLSALTDQNWKMRIEGVDGFKHALADLNPSEVSGQLLMKILNKKPGLKDTNFQALKMRLEAVKAVTEKFPVSVTCVDCILSDIVEKLSDPKCSGAAAEALTGLAEACRLEYVASQALEYALDKQKSPRVQTEIFSWLAGALRDFGLTINTKIVLLHVKKALAANNPAVRGAAVSFLGTLHLYMGPALTAFIEGEKPAIKQQIQQELDRLADEEAPTPVKGMSKSASKGSMGDELEENMVDDDYGGDDGSPPGASTNDVRPRVDIAPQITDALIQEMNDKNWKVRNEALEKVRNILNEAQLVKPAVGELPAALAPRLVDSNSKIAQLTLQVCEILATAIGPKAKQHIRALFPGIFQGLGDSKTWIRSAALQCINVWTAQCGVPSIFEGEIVFDALKSGGPILKAELWTWLAEKLPNAPMKSIPREELSVCIPLLYAALEDRGLEVRKAAGEAVLGFMMHLGPETMVRQTEKLKPGSKSVVQAAIEKARPNMPVQPLPKAADSKAIKSGGAQAKAQAQQKPGQAKPTKGLVKSASTSSARSKKDDDAEAFVPLLPINNTKHQRIIDDQKLKVLKWNFLTPREEFFDLLKDQMTSAGLNKSLIANMFHADFRYHIKAIESLIEDLADNGPALVCNLDLIFKWLTLRFFDTNPSVLLKGLEYLNIVFNYLINEDYHMAEYEASCFIPYLVLKVGDPKDTVRNGVKALLKQICVVYSVTKLFGYLMEGLKSKNARQRTECLEVLGLLIESYGVSICGPSPTAALKEIARQISDRDNSVRNAALNCVVQAYFLEGEKVYKMIGQISDKDHSLLEERIKRAAKGKDTTNRKSMLLPLSSTGRPIQQESNVQKQVIPEQNQPTNDYEEEEEEAVPNYPPPQMRRNSIAKMKQRMAEIKGRKLSNEVRNYPAVLSNGNGSTRTPSPHGLDEPANFRMNRLNGGRHHGLPQPVVRREQPRPVSGPFGLDPNVMAAIEDGLQEDIRAMTRRPVLQEMDLSFLDEPVAAPTGPPARPLSSALPLSPPSRPNMGMPGSRQSMMGHQVSPVAAHSQPSPALYEQDNTLTRNIQAIASPNLSVAVSALSQINGILSSHRANLMAPFEEQLLLAIVGQLQILQGPTQVASHSDILDAYRFLMTVLSTFYDGKIAGRNVSSATISALVDQLLRLLVSRALEKSCSEGEDKLVRVTNNVCVKVLERSDHTSLIVALINLLDKSVSGNPSSPRYQELEMKCLWKVMKLIPSWDSDRLDYDRLMLQLHLFFKAYPSHYWKRNTNIIDTPFRTIKTMVHTLVKKKGGSIMHHLSLIPDVNESELHAYLMKLFKSLKIDVNNCEPAAAPSAVSEGSPMKMVQEELSQILKRIGEKEHSMEALGQLYDFRERHPAVDIWSCLKDKSNFFRKYIERGLRDVADERRERGGGMAQHVPIVMPSSLPPSMPSSLPLSTMASFNNNMPNDPNDPSSKGHTYYSERLKTLRAKLGMGSESNSASNSQPRTPVIDNRTLADSLDDNGKQNIDPKFDLPSLHQTTSRSEPQMDALKQKLQQIKSSNR